MDEIPTQDFEQMAALRDRGVITQREFDTWCLRNLAVVEVAHDGNATADGFDGICPAPRSRRTGAVLSELPALEHVANPDI